MEGKSNSQSNVGRRRNECWNKIAAKRDDEKNEQKDVKEKN